MGTNRGRSYNPGGHEVVQTLFLVKQTRIALWTSSVSATPTVRWSVGTVDYCGRQGWYQGRSRRHGNRTHKVNILTVVFIFGPFVLPKSLRQNKTKQKEEVGPFKSSYFHIVFLLFFLVGLHHTNLARSRFWCLGPFVSTGKVPERSFRPRKRCL